MGKALVLKGTDFSVNKLDTISFGGQVPCTGISLSKDTISFDELSSTDTILATVTPSNTTDVIVWSTSDSSVATVVNGLVTAVGEGTATITATCGSQSATCSVSIELPLGYVMVSSYTCAKSTGSATWCSVSVNSGSGSTSNQFILAADSSDTSIHPVSFDETFDSSPFRFVPIPIPTGATAIKITLKDSTATFKTRSQFFDSTQTDGYKHYGAKLVNGKIEANGWDQSGDATWLNTQTIDIPDTAGIDSYCASVIGTGSLSGTRFTDCADLITLEFLYE